MKHSSKTAPLKRVAVAGAVFAAALSASSTASAATELLFNLFIPRAHTVYTGVLGPWAKNVEKASKGRLKIKFTDSSLGPVPRQFDMARTGIADITIAQHGFTPKRFVLMGMADLPFEGLSSEAASVALWRTYLKYFVPANEHRGVKLLSVLAIGPSHLWTIKKPVLSIADAHGLKIRANARYAKQVISALGAVIVSVPGPATYEVISNGTVDGTTLSITDVFNFRVNKFLNYVTVFPGGLYSATFSVVMNQSKWDRLSKADKAALMSASGENFARLARSWDEADKAAWKRLKDAGKLKVHFASPAFIGALKKKFEPLTAEWIAAAKKRGVDGAAALSFYRKTAAEIAKQSWKPAP